MSAGQEARLAAWSRLHPGIDPHTGVVGGWLRMVDRLSGPLAARRVPPDAITLLGLGCAAGATAAAATGAPRRGIAVAGLVGLSAVLDGLDGAVAVRTDRVTERGARLDTAADRLGEACFGAALALLGAPRWLAAAGVGAGWLLEGVRHRWRGSGRTDVVTVTVGERPTRVAVTAMFGLGVGVLAGSTTWLDPALWASLGAAALVVAGLVGTVQLAAARRRLG